MQRDLLEALKAWTTDPLRKPLILRGARQVGKSWLVRELGKTFSSFVEINFEKDKSVYKWFKGDVNIKRLINRLSLHCEQQIVPGKTLLFLDEIQVCPDALNALRFFKEDLPELHVITAGSLLDFVLDNTGMPVGRVQFMYLYPLSFMEYLTATNHVGLREYTQEKEDDSIIHEKILDLFKEYMWVGGLPAVVSAWINTQDVVACQREQDAIIEAYQQDFHKYAKDRQIPHLMKVFSSVPALLGGKFKYSQVDQDIKSALIKEALMMLCKAGITHVCSHTSAHQQPLGSGVNDKKFKVYFFDTGLAQRILGLDIKQWLLNPIQFSNSGAIAEQVVAQELTAYSECYKKSRLYYWHREAKSSNAEVDFLIIQNGKVTPVEVKSTRKGSMKSMHLYLSEHPESAYGIKVSEGRHATHANIREVPVFALQSTCYAEES